jgi:hypothetical protein
VALTARNDGEYNQAPSSIIIETSSDFLAWTEGFNGSCAGWSAGLTQTFAVAT